MGPYDLLISGALLLSAHIQNVFAYDNSRFDNVAVYWGQNSYGATHSDTANYQKNLAYYCQDDAIDVIPVAFLNVFFGPGGLPSMNLANTCNPTDNTTFSGSSLPNCSALASDIEFCQSKGKIVTLSLGGAGGGVGFTDDTQGQSFADTIWNLFLGGSSSTRPFGSAVLDGVDLDIEGGTSTGYAAFVNRIRSHATGASKQYYISAAPQCEYPDASLGATLDAASFDAVYVQFYNNPCGLQNFNTSSDWDFGLWDYWARNISPNPDVKIFIGAPASSTAAGGGYQDINTLSNIATQMRKSFPSFGGVMLWDASQAYVNNRYDLAIKNTLTAAGGTGFSFPTCSAPAWSSGNTYTEGSQVSYGGYIWEAKWWSASQPSSNTNSDWSAISACSQGGSSSTSAPTTSQSSTSKPPTTTTSPPVTSSTSSAPSSTPTSGGNCAGIAAWISSVAYTGGQQVIYSGHLWTAKWWTENDTPGGSAGVWTDDGECSVSVAASVTKNSTDPPSILKAGNITWTETTGSTSHLSRPAKPDSERDIQV
ncbi:glycoside hydrolase family 18 protein [Heterobasidion irregulare TC 32-1]|uniref:chitinase n=1 Tax=Heterobasidion irregulare (strain TC 32-1) TaxID=747525 RepID=W4KR49_HETIT|nr:glycoside hydrolase family 18 protein [Heterobasidion irregulare TC 32-1]ETW87551.1 glycoside hydrolase family 18 protein [Heterobasidion irregulare TC 32-1]